MHVLWRQPSFFLTLARFDDSTTPADPRLLCLNLGCQDVREELHALTLIGL
jgi:hypothetical protein